MIDFVAATAAESERFARAAALVAERADPAATMVPSCPDWSVDDLVWHLTEVQHFWASIVAGPLDDPGRVEPLTRPTGSAVTESFAEASARLITALAETEPETPCWSWYGAGRNAGWVRRRQAHEALIHRVDAELSVHAAGGPGVGPIDPGLAADGIDEMLRVMLGVDPLPAWAGFTPDGAGIALQALDAPAVRPWVVQPGRFAGTNPEGTAYDQAAIRVLDGADPVGDRVGATVRGPAAELDLWLWRRGSLHEATVEGDRALADWLPRIAAMT